MDDADLRKALLEIVADIGFEERQGIPDDAGAVERIMELVYEYANEREHYAILAASERE